MTSPVRAPRPTPRRFPDVAAAAPEHRPDLRPDLRVVARPARRSRTGVVVAAAMVVVFVALLASAVAHSLLVSGQAELDRVDREIRAEQELLQQDRLRLARYQSPQRIALVAAELGMVPADGETWLRSGSSAPPVATGTPAPGELGEPGEEKDGEHVKGDEGVEEGEHGGPDEGSERGPEGRDADEVSGATELALDGTEPTAGHG